MPKHPNTATCLGLKTSGPQFPSSRSAYASTLPTSSQILLFPLYSNSRPVDRHGKRLLLPSPGPLHKSPIALLIHPLSRWGQPLQQPPRRRRHLPHPAGPLLHPNAPAVATRNPNIHSGPRHTRPPQCHSTPPTHGLAACRTSPRFPRAGARFPRVGTRPPGLPAPAAASDAESAWCGAAYAG